MKVLRVYSVFQTDMKYTEHYVAHEMKERGHATTFISSNKYLSTWLPYLKSMDGAGYYKYQDYDVYRLDSWFPGQKAIFKNWFHLFQLLFRDKYDVYHLYGLGNFSTIITIILSFFSSKRIRFIISDHSDTRTHKRTGKLASIYHHFFRFWILLLKKRIFRVVTFSDVGIGVLSKRFRLSKDKFSVIPLGYDQRTYYFDSEKKNSEDKLVIGYAGKIDEKKSVHTLIQNLSDSGISADVRLIIVGVKDDDYCRNLRLQASGLDLEVEFRPFATSKELAEFYNYIDIAVYPGGISITTIEASGCGTPVVIFESIANLESRVENGRGKLFKTSNEMISIISSYIEAKREGRIRNTDISKVTRKSSSWEGIIKNYLKLYKEVSNGKG